MNRDLSEVSTCFILIQVTDMKKNIFFLLTKFFNTSKIDTIFSYCRSQNLNGRGERVKQLLEDKLFLYKVWP